jgi:uncharacterized membrane protein
MESLFILLGLAAVAGLILGPIGFFQSLGLRRRLDDAETRLALLEAVARRAALTPRAAAAAPAAPAPDDIAPAASAPPAPLDAAAEAAPLSDAPSPPGATASVPSFGRRARDEEPLQNATGPDADAGARARPDLPAATARGPGLEERFGARWTVLVGGVALALGALLLVKYSIDAGVFGPGMRVLAGLAFGAALIGAGEWMRRRDRTSESAIVSIPAALTAAGTVALFGAIYAAHALYGFIGPAIAFLLLGATGVATMLAAALHGPALAGVGLVGSLGAPLLVHSARPNPWPLVIYLLAVAGAAYGLARFRRWLWLAGAAAIGVGLWQGLLVLDAHSLDIFRAALAHGLAQTAVALGVFVLPLTAFDDSAAQPDPLATAVPAMMGLGALGALTATPGAHFGLMWMLGGAALVGLLAFGAQMSAAVALLAPAAAVAGLAALRLWPGANPLEAVPRMDFDWLVAMAPPRDIGWFTAFGAAASLAIGAAAARRLIAERPAPVWAAATLAATAAGFPLAALVLAYLRIGGWTISYPFAAVAGFLALGFVAAAAFFRARAAQAEHPGARMALGFFATGAIAALAMGFMFVLSGGTLTVALALAALGAAFVATRLDLDAVRWCVAALGLVVAARLVWEPRIVADLGTTPILNWLLFGYGVPAAAFAGAAWLMRREPEDLPLQVAQALALVFAALLVFFEIRHATNGGDVFAMQGRLMEAGLQTFAALAFGAATIIIGGRNPSPVFKAATLVAGVVSLGGALLALGLFANPLFTGDAIAGGAIVNELLVGYGLPAAAAVGLAIVARKWRPGLYQTAASALALIFIVAYASLQTRLVFQGPILSLRREPTEPELYAYSVVWLALGLAMLAYGVLRHSREARLGSAALVALATLKIFIYDMAGLEGPLRALSFIGLGVVLIGIGRVYQKYVFARPAAAPGAE